MFIYKQIKKEAKILAKKKGISYGQALNKCCEKQGFTNFNDFKRQLKQNQKYLMIDW